MLLPRLPLPAGAGLTLLLSLFLSSAAASQILNTTAAGADLQTWWHDSGEINFETAVADENVRQSHLYSAWISTDNTGDGTLYIASASSRPRWNPRLVF